jgi:hypothetical protein
MPGNSNASTIQGRERGKATAMSCDPISTLSLSSTNRPSMEHDDSSLSKRKACIKYQLDSLHGSEFLGLHFLSGLDKRLNGGTFLF